jgi:uncharacterized spore protein YtfJ
MDGKEILEKLGEALGSKASVKSVFGEPIQADGKTVVPIARVAYGFGGGFGAGPRKNGDYKGEGGGGGGGVVAYPAGVLEITSEQTRFIPFVNLRWMAAAFGIGALAATLLVRRLR